LACLLPLALVSAKAFEPGGWWRLVFVSPFPTGPALVWRRGVWGWGSSVAARGFAVVGFYARRPAAPPLLRAFALVLVLVNPWAPQILALLGLFDNWFDFRRFAEPPSGQQTPPGPAA